jgi:hypothetical protein
MFTLPRQFPPLDSVRRLSTMVDCQPAFLPFETPPSGRSERLLAQPFDAMPTTPRCVGNRVSSEIVQRILSNLETLSTPSLTNVASPSSYIVQQSSFDAELRSKGEGRETVRLMAEKDNFCMSAAPSQTLTKDKLSSTSVVTLDKKMPRRNSGVAMSA